MNHTPGPWELGRSGTVVTPHPVKNAPIGADNCTHYGGNLICESVTEANARLIAQAPDLLWACESFVVMYELSVKCSAVDRLLLDRAKDIIEKAKGVGL
ncbi:MAG TPA: hypothetical protein VHO03_17155 [Ignavibacteriales bacterium]|nr:hypothetical protein [Ignavibacteriales bacterium]